VSSDFPKFASDRRSDLRQLLGRAEPGRAAPSTDVHPCTAANNSLSLFLLPATHWQCEAKPVARPAGPGSRPNRRPPGRWR